MNAKKLLDPKKSKALSRYIQVAQRAFNLDAVEIYSINSKRLTLALASDLENEYLRVVSADNLQREKGSDGAISVTEAILTGELIRTIGTVPFGAQKKTSMLLWC